MVPVRPLSYANSVLTDSHPLQLMLFQTIPQYERAVVFRLGRIKDGRVQGPGIIYLFPCLDQMEKVDTRLKTFDVPPQKVGPAFIVSKSSCN